jgi:hypothetical protein
MNTSLAAVQHIRPMRGGSQSHLMRASDGAYYVVKFQNNPQHLRVLANELIAGRLGRWLGLPIPPVEIIAVSAWLVEHSPEMRVHIASGSKLCRCGRQLASFYGLPDSEGALFDYLPEDSLKKVANLGDFARMLVLDKWTANNDGRQAIFRRAKGQKKFHAEFIDQGYCFNGGDWAFSDSSLRGVFANPVVYAGVTGWEDFDPVLSRAERASATDLWSCAAGLPEEWYEADRSALERLIEQLYRRRLIIRDLIDQFRRSSRNPFPNWDRGAAPAPAR